MLNSLGNVHRRQRNYAEAEKDYAGAFSIRQELANEQGGRYQLAVSQTLNNIGLLENGLGRIDSAIKAYQDSLAISERLAQTDKEALVDVARTWTNLGSLYADAHRLADAADAFEKAVGTRKQILSAFPERAPEMRALLAHTYTLQCFYYTNTENGEQAVRIANEVVHSYEELSQEAPATYKPAAAEGYYLLGDSFHTAKQHTQALEAFQRSLAVYEDLAREDPAKFVPQVAGAHRVLSASYGALHRSDDAIRESNTATAMYVELAKKDQRYLEDEADSHSLSGALYSANSKYGEAEVPLSKALALYRLLDAMGAKSYKDGISDAQRLLAVVYINTDRQMQADASFTEALAISAELAKKDKERYLDDVIITLNAWAYFYRTPTQRPNFAPQCPEGRAVLKSFSVVDVQTVAPYFADACPFSMPGK